MSILSSLYHGEPADLPNEVHNNPPVPLQEVADDGTRIYHGSASLRSEQKQHTDIGMTAGAKHRCTAMQQGSVRPTMAYSEEEHIPCPAGAWAPPHTVASELEAREEMPLG